ncbi:MAG: 30S ribosomal protein S6 [Clostridia bacterium]|nr:30S ribosomal protein S6 [Clostridia bacterium]
MAGVINSYETIVVVTAKNGEENAKAVLENVKGIISKYATLESVDEWGKRRFAYEIEKQTEGYYTLINFKAEADFTAELDRRYRINDQILRHIIVKKDPRYLEGPKAKKAAVDVEAIAVESAIEAE